MMSELRARFKNMTDELFEQNKEQLERAFGSLGTKKKGNHPEADIQKSCVSWFDTAYPNLSSYLFMIKNDGNKKKTITKSGKAISLSAIRDKIMGLRPGVSDLLLSLPTKEYHGYYIELKTETGTQSPEQRRFEILMTSAGYKYSVIRSQTWFIKSVTSYMEEVDPLIKRIYVK